jgi:lysophospholipase L1-like esterase
MASSIHKIHPLLCAGVLFVLLAFGCTASWAQNQWEPAIRAFEAQDAQKPPPRNAVLFIGSSSIRWWRTSELFSGFPVINRGFGGALISDINYYVKRIVIPYKPKVIVFYCGYNDLFVGKKSPEQVFNDFNSFVAAVHGSLPKTRIIFMSLTPGPSAWGSRQLLYEVNGKAKELSEKHENLFYADVATGMLNSKGVPDPNDYQEDGVHLTYKADIKWAALLRPTLKKVYNLK